MPNATPQEIKDALLNSATKDVVTSAKASNNRLLYLSPVCNLFNCSNRTAITTSVAVYQYLVWLQLRRRPRHTIEAWYMTPFQTYLQ